MDVIYSNICSPLVVNLWRYDHLMLLLSLQHLFAVDTVTEAVDFVFLLITETAGWRIFSRDVDRLRV
jgi:hypothetical protein